ncbi:HAD-like protein [Trametopsis cervina]|nr:HAD-like protein [Trametopsis cervina]
MSELDLTKFKALVFDCYGTLVDWEEGIYQGLQPMLRRVKPSLSSKKEALVAFNAVEVDLQAKYPTMLYRDILAHTHAELAARLQGKPTRPDDGHSVAVTELAPHAGGQTSSSMTTAGSSSAANQVAPSSGLKEEDITFANSIAGWQPFPDTIPALVTLSKYYKLAILSNVDNDSFAFTRALLESSAEYPFKFDAVYTAQDIGSYKPDVANFKYALKNLHEEFGIEKHEVLVTAGSLAHDHVPANQLGLNSVWIAREGAAVAQEPVATYDMKFSTLGEMAGEVVRQR